MFLTFIQSELLRSYLQVAYNLQVAMTRDFSEVPDLGAQERGFEVDSPTTLEVPATKGCMDGSRNIAKQGHLLIIKAKVLFI